jgi:hypothetical protein
VSDLLARFASSLGSSPLAFLGAGGKLSLSLLEKVEIFPPAFMGHTFRSLVCFYLFVCLSTGQDKTLIKQSVPTFQFPTFYFQTITQFPSFGWLCNTRE